MFCGRMGFAVLKTCVQHAIRDFNSGALAKLAQNYTLNKYKLDYCVGSVPVSISRAASLWH